MTYRGVVRHVRYWRGSPHVWSTVYQFVGTPSKPFDTAAAQLLLQADDAMCAKTPASEGGTFVCEIYNHASGGVPIASYQAFDHTNLAAWPGYGLSSHWLVASGALAQPAEAALGVRWIMGLSSSGKPVYARKWYHAVPPASPGSANPDVPATSLTALTTAANAMVGVLASYGVTLGSSAGRFAGTATVNGQYEAHQMPRGRRRKALVTASGKYTGPTVVIPD